MDYEKKYNEIKHRVYEIGAGIAEGVDYSKPRQIAEYIDPELRESESEDERMIRKIESFLSAYGVDYFSNDEWWEIEVWLEKQKEQKEELVYRLNGLMQDYIKEGKDDEEKEHRLKCYRLFWDALEDANFFEQKEQKPAEWSEEQMNIIKDVLSYLNDEYGFRSTVDEMKFRQGLARRLKSLRLQPKQEWSEEYREEDLQTRFAFYTYKDDPSVLYLSNVFVEESSRNHGFGTRILKAAEKAAEAIGATTICLKVKQDSPANAWYRKHGYGYVAFEDGYDWLEKNLEYLKPTKSAEWSEKHIADVFEKVGLAKIVREQGNNALTNALQDAMLELSKMENTEWSEEEKDKLNSIERLIVNANAHGNYLIGDKEATDLQHFIRSIVKPTTNLAEWSEEDEKMFCNLIGIMEGKTGVIPGGWKKYVDWLKNRFRYAFPMPHWKPTDELLEALHAAAYIDEMEFYGGLKDKLRELYEQLKKL